MTKAIQKRIRLPQPQERVWAALATSGGLTEWMYPNNFEPRVGHRFTFQVPPKPDVGFDGLTVQCEVLACEPPHLLTFSWTAGGPVVNTRVSFRLEADGDATLLHFEHVGFDLTQPWGEQALQGADYGWAEMFNTLSATLAVSTSRHIKETYS